MNPHRKFHPELQACELEDRLVPVISNLGTIVLTTGGYVLLNPFPGASSTPGSSSSGTAIPTSFSMTGSGGISSVQPGNSTGIQSRQSHRRQYPRTAGSQHLPFRHPVDLQ